MATDVPEAQIKLLLRIQRLEDGISALGGMIAGIKGSKSQLVAKLPQDARYPSLPLKAWFHGPVLVEEPCYSTWDEAAVPPALTIHFFAPSAPVIILDVVNDVKLISYSDPDQLTGNGPFVLEVVQQAKASSATENPGWKFILQFDSRNPQWSEALYRGFVQWLIAKANAKTLFKCRPLVAETLWDTAARVAQTRRTSRASLRNSHHSTCPTSATSEHDQLPISTDTPLDGNGVRSASPSLESDSKDVVSHPISQASPSTVASTESSKKSVPDIDHRAVVPRKETYMNGRNMNVIANPPLNRPSLSSVAGVSESESERQQPIKIKRNLTRGFVAANPYVYIQGSSRGKSTRMDLNQYIRGQPPAKKRKLDISDAKVDVEAGADREEDSKGGIREHIIKNDEQKGQKWSMFKPESSASERQAPRQSCASRRGLLKPSAGGRLEPQTLVWAKSASFEWWPAVIVHDDDERIPLMVLKEANAKREMLEKDWSYIIRFYNETKSWQHLSLDKMRALGVSQELDQDMLAENSIMQPKSWKASIRKDCQRAYKMAIEAMVSDDEEFFA